MLTLGECRAARSAQRIWLRACGLWDRHDERTLRLVSVKTPLHLGQSLASFSSCHSGGALSTDAIARGRSAGLSCEGDAGRPPRAACRRSWEVPHSRRRE